MPGLLDPNYGVTPNNLNPTDVSYLPSNNNPGLINTSPNVNLPSNGQPVNWSYIQGALAAKDESRKQQNMAISQQVANENAQEFGWKAQDREKNQIINAGMAQAAQQGGYEGTIQYLQQADPARAQQFEYAKNQLDKQILDNQTLQNTLDTNKQKAMFESYGLLGRFGQAILNAPAKDREAMYEQMKPMIQQVVPNPPADLQSAIPMFMLSAAQAMPASQLFAVNKEAADLKTEQGKLIDDITKASKTYGATSDQVQLLQGKLQNNLLQDHYKQVHAATIQSQAGATVASQLNNLNFRINKDALDVKNNYDKLSQTTDEPTSPNQSMVANDLNLVMATLKMMNPNLRVNPKTFELVGDISSVPAEIVKKYNAVLQGGVLAPEERKAFRQQAAGIYQSRMRAYDASQSEISRAAVANGIDPSQLVSPVIQAPSTNYTTSQLTTMYNEAMQKAGNNSQIQQQLTQRYQQMLQKAQGNTGAQGGE